MSRHHTTDQVYSAMPLDASGDRDESFLIDALGTWIPECDIILYGLMNSPIGERFYKIRENIITDQLETYRSQCFFTARDLIRYLSSVDESLDDLSEEEIAEAFQMALRYYQYTPSNETMMRHSIMEVMYHDFVKSVTLVYPWNIRPIDHLFIRRITPEKIFNKLEVAVGDIPSVVRSSDRRYTTIITNELSDIKELTKDPKGNRVDTALFLLRNHSGNVKITKGEDGEDTLVEIGSEELLPIFVDEKTGIPKSQMRFGRFEPLLFVDMNKAIPNFNKY